MFHATMNFALGTEIDQVRDSVMRYAQSRIAPIAAKIDRDNDLPREVWRELGELGLLGITADPDYGGAGMGYLAHVVVVEELARASASLSLSYGAHSNLCVNQINRNGTTAQKQKIFAGFMFWGGNWGFGNVRTRRGLRCGGDAIAGRENPSRLYT